MNYVLVLEVDTEPGVIPARDRRLADSGVTGLRSTEVRFHCAHVHASRGHFPRSGANFQLVVHHYGLCRQGRGGQQQHQGQGEFHEPDYNSWAARRRTGGGAPVCRNVNCVAVWPAHD
jgi:hypothetical protein